MKSRWTLPQIRATLSASMPPPCNIGDLDIVRALVEAGADVNAEGFCNPLEYAELGIIEGHHKGGQHAEVIELLKQAGATKSQNF
ncbi:hypothetical protein [Coleofasciculus sp. H7-2]|uniref:hypothetical protein n=1 Tax=Coleofasciculus sp. H7-2 TaxID=3351545 RepID=UPI00366D9564